ncbi:uncharacterized protein MYCGRDRAFT_106436 [Zymoseptoria tritici IPO323]|uniref:Uncharacterized protein n=1 Tax=Zymoseptoria tritici (strain CBS 115943 / IPO323) TaxID=336722 RepID=F9XPK9_ZYMTI|nr:uncharacterized protein MYCGRDRAFT_106436 [Zymoseptoria tritici IPO323]EGP82813.1 hypothetical protein MYCGRDRAFT_106436 [Zymoseptoria tritici IPO323]
MKAFAITNLAATAAVLMGLLSPMAAARCMRDEDISKGLTPDQACSAHVKTCGPSECPKCEHNTCVCLACTKSGGDAGGSLLFE